jgi:hypothetical protein
LLAAAEAAVQEIATLVVAVLDQEFNLLLTQLQLLLLVEAVEVAVMLTIPLVVLVLVAAQQVVRVLVKLVLDAVKQHILAAQELKVLQALVVLAEEDLVQQVQVEMVAVAELVLLNMLVV